MGILSDKNVQAMVPAETHKMLRDIAYVKGMALRDLIREILVNYALSAYAEIPGQMPKS